MSKSTDGQSSSTYYWGQGGTGGDRERLDEVDRGRDARVGWTKGGRLKIKQRTDTTDTEDKER